MLIRDLPKRMLAILCYRDVLVLFAYIVGFGVLLVLAILRLNEVR